jgi:hypothetical protein
MQLRQGLIRVRASATGRAQVHCYDGTTLPCAEFTAPTKHTSEGSKVHSFQTLLGDLATIVKNKIQPADKSIAAFDLLTQPTVDSLV